MASYERLKYAASEFGNNHCPPNKVNAIKKNPIKEQDLNKDNLLPGQMVSADHYILRDPGRIYHTKMEIISILYVLSSIYSHLVLNSRITTGMVN